MSNKLDDIQIPKPCPTDWEEMTGNDRMRYCKDCKKHVYNLSKMSRREAEALIATRRGNLCARIIRNPDGTVLTEEFVSKNYPAIRRASPVASAVVTAILTISSSAAAERPAIMNKPIPTITNESRDLKPDSDPQTGGGTASIAGTVTDRSGAVVRAATVRLINSQAGIERTTSTGEDGGYNFGQVDAGTYVLEFKYPGFATETYTNIDVQQGDERRVDVKMGAAFVSMGGAVALTVYPLRGLYEISERIVVASVGKSTKVETEGESSLIKTQLKVSSTLKGSGRERTVDVYNWVYGEANEMYASGTNLLIFLKRRQGEQGVAKDGYEAADSQRSVKKLSEADLQVYMQRIEELSTIMSKENTDQTEIVEWLVRCAENPATRWEGVYELARSAESLPVDEDESEATEETAEAEEVSIDESESEAVEESTEAVSEEESNEPALITLLTAAQKERLNQILFSIKTISEDDTDLIELVQHWDDGRLVPFLLAQLKQLEANPPRLAEDIVNLISNSLNDEEVTALAEQFSEKVSYEDIDAEEEAAAAAEAEETEEIEETEEAEPAEAAEDVEEAEDAEEEEAIRSPDEARQNRIELLRKFIALVESKAKK